MGQITEQLRQTFVEVYGTEPEESFFAPGRVNLIGEHTDYNGGHVFPCAITLGTYAWVKPRSDKKLRLYSDNFPKDGIRELDMTDLAYRGSDSWANYVKGVFVYLADLGFAFPHGMDIAFYGNIPNGSGLSSSASFELLVGVIARKVYTLDIDTLGLVKVGKLVENDFIGVNSGIMDQFAVGMGKKDHAIFLDCATLEYELLPVKLGDYRIVIMNTNKRRELADSKYNERFAAKGYDVTIMDFSTSQLQKDAMVAKREGLTINTVQADMTKPFPFEDKTFDIIFNPVSNVYIDDLKNMYKEASRVLKKGGLLMVGFMNPWIYMYDADVVWDQPDEELLLKFSIPFNSKELEEQGKIIINPEYGYEFSHTLETQIRGQLKNGLAMIDFYESCDKRHRLSQFGNDYIATLCVKL